MEGQWVVSSLDRLENVLDAIAVGICGPKQKQEVIVDPKKIKKDKRDKKGQKGGEEEILPHHSKKIIRAARYLLRCLLNRLGCVPPPRCGVSSVSSLITEVFFFFFFFFFFSFFSSFLLLFNLFLNTVL